MPTRSCRTRRNESWPPKPSRGSCVVRSANQVNTHWAHISPTRTTTPLHIKSTHTLDHFAVLRSSWWSPGDCHKVPCHRVKGGVGSETGRRGSHDPYRAIVARISQRWERAHSTGECARSARVLNEN